MRPVPKIYKVFYETPKRPAGLRLVSFKLGGAVMVVQAATFCRQIRKSLHAPGMISMRRESATDSDSQLTAWEMLVLTLQP